MSRDMEEHRRVHDVKVLLLQYAKRVTYINGEICISIRGTSSRTSPPSSSRIDEIRFYILKHTRYDADVEVFVHILDADSIR